MPRRALVLMAVVAAARGFAAEPLHDTIDRLITTGTPDYAKKAAPLADDAEFLRRAWLDLAGSIPTPAEARAFFDDRSADKRSKLIDRLLECPEHAKHLAAVFDDFLMDRRPDKHVPAGDWRKFLVDSFAANRPYDVLVREILAADGAEPKARAAARFYLDREAEPNLLTRDVGRLFLGMNLTCCQCHDHPLVNSYKQDYYYGLFAFLARTQIAADVKPAALGEKADGDTTF